MKPFMTPPGKELAGYCATEFKRDLHENKTTDGIPTRVTDLYDGQHRFETIDGKDHTKGV